MVRDVVSGMPKLPSEQGCMSHAHSLQAMLWVKRSRVVSARL